MYISTPTYGMSQQSLHEWVGTDSMKGGGGNGRKNCSFHFPWHAISILYPQLSKSYLKHINFIFLGWMGPQRITSRHCAAILGLKRMDENDNSVPLACSIGLLILLLVKKRRGEKSHLKRHLPPAKENTVYWGNWWCLSTLVHQRKGFFVYFLHSSHVPSHRVTFKLQGIQHCVWPQVLSFSDVTNGKIMCF